MPCRLKHGTQFYKNGEWHAAAVYRGRQQEGSCVVSIELALSVVEAERVEDLFERMPERVSRYTGQLGGRTFSRLQFGSEFCENLVPSLGAVRRMVAFAESKGLEFSLATPLSSDRAIRLVRRLFPLLPSGSEVVASDWGILRLLKEWFPKLVPVAGRIICREIKDPRLPSAHWAALYPHGIHAKSFTAVLKSFDVRRVEMDVAPYSTADDFRSSQMRVSVHVPWGFAAKGRACRIGSLHRPEGEKFASGHKCRRECLVYAGRMRRSRTHEKELETFQRGNALFYRHSEDMTKMLSDAVAAGAIDRIVVSGDWP